MKRAAPVVLVSGGNRGIGFEACRSLLSAGEALAAATLDDERTGVFVRDGQVIPW